MTFYFSKTLAAPFADVLARTRKALEAEDFSVVTEIDMADVFKRKLDLEFRSYRILGVCNPALAHAAVSLNDSVGLLLPCNVVVQDAGDDLTEVAIVDPVATMTILNDPVLVAPAEAVAQKLRRVIDRL